ncbi:MAG: TlpA disulfide reductase family protein [Anaeromyxobacter sp.]
MGRWRQAWASCRTIGHAPGPPRRPAPPRLPGPPRLHQGAGESDLARFGVDRAPGGAAPDFTLQGIDGKPVTLAQLKGQVIFVNFWATWCPPCRSEMPSMLALGRELEARHPGKFRMLAVSVDDGWDPVREFLNAPPFLGKLDGVTVALDDGLTATKAYYCAARGACPSQYQFPESYVIDRDGKLVAFVVGPREWTDPTAAAWLESLIK